MLVEPVVLVGKYVRLEPLSMDHINELTLIGDDPEIWKYMIYGMVTTQEKMREWVVDILARKAVGFDQPFVVRNLLTGELAGATRYLEIRSQHRSLEIGGTWYGKKYRRTIVNTEAKYLLLCHAFETLGCIRVQFKANLLNERSIKAIERLGAIREGVLRNHMILDNGTYRDSVYFSIIDSEWPFVKRRILGLLEQK